MNGAPGPSRWALVFLCVTSSLMALNVERFIQARWSPVVKRSRLQMPSIPKPGVSPVLLSADAVFGQKSSLLLGFPSPPKASPPKASPPKASPPKARPSNEPGSGLEALRPLLRQCCPGHSASTLQHRGDFYVFSRRRLLAYLRQPLTSDPNAYADFYSCRKGAPPVGVRFAWIRERSWYPRLGLRPKDVILRFNGIGLRSTQQLMAVYPQLTRPRCSRITLDLLRQCELRRITVDLR